MSNIASRLTNVRKPLKRLNRLEVARTVAPSRYNTCSIRLQKYGKEHLVANGRYCYCFAEWVHLDQFQKQISKSTACLLQYIDIIHAVRQELFLISEYFVFLLLVPVQKLGSLIT